MHLYLSFISEAHVNSGAMDPGQIVGFSESPKSIDFTTMSNK